MKKNFGYLIAITLILSCSGSESGSGDKQAASGSNQSSKKPESPKNPSAPKEVNLPGMSFGLKNFLTADEIDLVVIDEILEP